MWSPVEMAIICGRPHRVAPTAEPLSDIVGNAFMHSAKKSHNGTDKSVPYGRALPPITLIIRVEEIAVDCRFEQRRRTGVLRAVKNGEIR